MVQPVPSRGARSAFGGALPIELEDTGLQAPVGIGPEDALDLSAGQLVVEMQGRRAR